MNPSVSSFDRHALDLLDRMLTLDPTQVYLVQFFYLYLLCCSSFSPPRTHAILDAHSSSSSLENAICISNIRTTLMLALMILFSIPTEEACFTFEL